MLCLPRRKLQRRSQYVRLSTQCREARLETDVLIKLQSLIENYGNNQPQELESVLVKFQDEVITLEQIDYTAVKELEDAMSLSGNWEISTALGLDVMLAIGNLMDHTDGIQTTYLSLMSKFLREML